jgi:hypothetical protein
MDFPAPGRPSMRTLWSQRLHGVQLHPGSGARGPGLLTRSQSESNGEDQGQANSSSSAFASCRSAVSDPSVNQRLIGASSSRAL